MADVKIIHTGDFHIGASRTAVHNGKAEIKNTFFKMLNICKSEDVDFLLISGDLFDTPFVDSDTVSEVIRAMSQIPETVIAIAPGNHDCSCPGSVYLNNSFPENVVIFSHAFEFYDFPHKNVRLHGAAFCDRFENQSLLPESISLHPEMINLCVLHGDLVSNISESNYNPITKTQISNSGFDYMALGHIHKRSELQKLGNTYYSYCGCPDGKGFDESGSLGIYMGTVGKGKCDLTYTELSSRKYVFVESDISDCKNSLEISDKIHTQIKTDFHDDFQNNLYRITLTGNVSTDFSPNVPQISESLKSCLYYVQISDKTEPDISDVSSIAAENSLRGIFTSKVLELMNTASPDEAEKYRLALQLGIKAFEREVTLNDN